MAGNKALSRFFLASPYNRALCFVADTLHPLHSTGDDCCQHGLSNMNDGEIDQATSDTAAIEEQTVLAPA
ncbi:hypothetical protein H4R24_001969 [Coemansia sp. RSA 988]|nr:hypothetical protein H4R24_001969 [Coemansia sp. RSA 988]